ncbi:MAG: hypothetical protein A3I61_09465 [Acidobacteria bacterium RIFCSPLOWO2_02_FULL_68_18]|nr:MAG: hypothetical protein A3I61_09465 [Acidobacteria bacterium RIFCSPLOWO2_02_FULL_68_18]OFW51064.1 MAG: hypothetical protein A3G77_15690 [Acidobacteria bacterium RIFCSPLOWO2_12_FULL_68_19]
MSTGAPDSRVSTSRAPEAGGRRWWNARRIALAAIGACAVGAVAFLFRFNALGGALGGFDNDHFIYLVRTDSLLAGEQPLRDFVDAELRGAWPALTYAASAWAQQLGGRTLLSEAYLTVGLLALADVLVFLLALDLSRRWSVALLAAAVAVTTVPKLYNYPKVLVLALGVWLVRAAASQPTSLRLGLGALLTAAAVLFRHDLGIYVAGALVTALLARDLDRWRLAARHTAVYVALAAACLLPSAAWVQIYEGLPQYVRDAAESVAAEQGRTNLTLQPLDWSAPLARSNLEAVTYYVFWAVPVVAAVVLLCRLVWRRGTRLTRDARATAIGLLVMAVLGNRSFLRANLAERFGDVVVAVALLAAWVAGTAPLWTSAIVRRVVVAVPVALLVVVLGTSVVVSEVAHELRTGGLTESWEDTLRRYRAVREELGRVPPAVWTDGDEHGTLRAARYVAECTRPDDRVLGIGPVHEIHVYARRRFAAGQALFKLSLYRSEAFQRRALERLSHESVPVVIAEIEELGLFGEQYPLVSRYLGERYRDAGTITVDDEPRFRVLVAVDREPTRIDARFGLPCFA